MSRRAAKPWPARRVGLRFTGSNIGSPSTVLEPASGDPALSPVSVRPTWRQVATLGSGGQEESRTRACGGTQADDGQISMPAFPQREYCAHPRGKSRS